MASGGGLLRDVLSHESSSSRLLYDGLCRGIILLYAGACSTRGLPCPGRSWGQLKASLQLVQSHHEASCLLEFSSALWLELQVDLEFY